MIVTCEKCDTRYRLDESRLSGRGSRVRCSRCKHSFQVKAEAPSGVDAVNEVAEHAAAQAGAPHVTQHDLLRIDTENAAAEAAKAPETSQADADDEDIDWQFNEVPPVVPAPPEPPPKPAPVLDTGTDAEPFDFGALPDEEAGPQDTASDLLGGAGSLLGDDASDLHGTPLDPSDTVVAPSKEPADDAGFDGWKSLIDGEERDENEAVDASAPGAAAAAEASPEVDPSPGKKVAIGRLALVAQGDAVEPVARQRAAPVGPPILSRTLNATGWLSVLALLAFVVHGSLARSGQSPTRSAALAGLVAEDVRGRFVENALGGTFYVVSGQLRKPEGQVSAAEALIQVSLLDAAGAPIEGGRTWAGPALSDAQLRESPPELLRAELATRARSLAQMPVGPVAVLQFDAIFEELPSGAERFLLETVSEDRLPRAP